MNTTSLLVKEHYLIEQVLNCLEKMKLTDRLPIQYVPCLLLSIRRHAGFR